MIVRVTISELNDLEPIMMPKVAESSFLYF